MVRLTQYKSEHYEWVNGTATTYYNKGRTRGEVLRLVTGVLRKSGAKDISVARQVPRPNPLSPLGFGGRYASGSGRNRRYRGTLWGGDRWSTETGRVPSLHDFYSGVVRIFRTRPTTETWDFTEWCPLGSVAA